MPLPIRIKNYSNIQTIKNICDKFINLFKYENYCRIEYFRNYAKCVF